MDSVDTAEVAAEGDIAHNRVVKAYMKMRDARSKLKRAYEEEDGKIKEQMELLESHLLDFCNTTGVKSFRTQFGTVIKEEDILPTGSDWDAFYRWVAENDAFDALERRIKKTFVAQYMEDHKGGVPPGVSVLRKYKVVIRRSKES